MSSSLFATAKIYTNVVCVLGPEGTGEHQQQPWGRRDDTQAAAAAHEKPIKPNPHHIESPHFIFSLSTNQLPQLNSEREWGVAKKANDDEKQQQKHSSIPEQSNINSRPHPEIIFTTLTHTRSLPLSALTLCVMLPIPFHVENFLPPQQRHPHIANFPLECAAHICLFMV